MNFEQFVSAMAAGIKEYTTREEYVEKQEILRNNGVVSVGIVIRTKKQKAAPLIYLEEYYQKYQEGAPLETLVQHLLDRSRHAPAPPVWDYEEILNFEKIKSRIVYKMINAKQNEKLLEKVPNLPILDFAIVFYLLISADDEGECSVLIRNEHMNLWEVPISVLYQMAKNNTPKLCPYRIKSICECIEIPEEESVFQILTNEQGINGATAILYPNIPQKIYHLVNGNYYLIPSSVHEFLIVPENQGIHAEGLCRILREVNETEIDPEEYLGDEIYYFDGDIITKM